MDNGIYYLHIQKTGGTSFISFLDSHFAPESICPAQLLPELFQSPPEDMSHFSLYRGHLWYGLNSYLHRNLNCITLLRDPVQRTVSYYSHVKRDENSYRHREVVDGNWSILDFVRDQQTNWDTTNSQTLFLTVDLDYSKLAADPVGYGQAVVKRYAARREDRALLDLAKKRLEQFMFVGITERMQESIELFSWQMGWDPGTPAPSLNISSNRPSEDELTLEAREAIMAINPLDQELYAWARQRFEEQFVHVMKARAKAS